MGVNPDGIPRYAEPMWDELNEDELRDRCGNCRFFKDVEHPLNGTTECIGTCIYEVAMAADAEELRAAEVLCVDPQDEPCSDYKR